jgi:Cu/Zn superoxide dismutase
MKHKGFLIAAISFTVVVLSLASAAKTVVEMKDAQGKSVGTVTLVESGTGPKGAGVGLELNLHVNDSGTANQRLTNDDVRLGDGTDSHSLFANGGTAIVIHANPDDMTTDPSGSAGDRIACGLITK